MTKLSVFLFCYYYYLGNSHEFCCTELEMSCGRKHACLLYQQYLSNEDRELLPSSAFANQLLLQPNLLNAHPLSTI